ncbi:hypothetical protein DICVIV_07633, partial [Dictyocaulus viviparus]
SVPYIHQKVSAVACSHSAGRSFRQPRDVSISKKDSEKNRESSLLRANKVLKDNPVSMLGEEYFNPNYRELHERSRRRHTTPVKTSTALRRNQPNTRHSGLVFPKRRATVINANDQEKENRDCYRNVPNANTSGLCSDFDGEVLETKNNDLIDSCADLLTQKGEESRLRRVKRQQRKEISSLLRDSILDSSLAQNSIPLEDNMKGSRVMMSASCSPIVFARTEDTVFTSFPPLINTHAHH